MKKIVILFLFIIFLYPIPYIHPISAHGAGLPPFFKINGILAPASPFQIAGIYSSVFQVPQDNGPQNYLKDVPIDFEIDINALEAVLPKEVVQKTTYSWDFGDNSTGDGIKNTHKYSKIGSYVLSITADYHQPNLAVPQFIESVQLNILPNQDYELPQAVIRINGKKSNEQPLAETFDIDLNQRLNFDATDSKAPSSKIVEYVWNFDDGQNSKQALTSHRYKLPQFYISPSLMVKDENGFISYIFFDITNSGKNDPNNPQLEDFKETAFKWAPLGLGFLVVLGGLIILIKKRSTSDE